ncbi:Tim10/DDP family zinc finger-domain-containing protein [Collybia nuda]|uniref:Mitochondrial import inner membrane translocase subunit n=1 Tax=Collybia nuda TaxID=64659 RepID=A0A9P5YDF6_9AGAR|nr:Tim10/DDP family zinc finger-domain-containing protein [Collybia nuda]
MGTSTSPADMAAKKEQIMSSVKNEIALANAQELMNVCHRMAHHTTCPNESCFSKCVTKPGSSLSGSEQTCLSRCLDRYMEAFNIVSRTYITRISRERVEGQ